MPGPQYPSQPQPGSDRRPALGHDCTREESPFSTSTPLLLGAAFSSDRRNWGRYPESLCDMTEDLGVVAHKNTPRLPYWTPKFHTQCSSPLA